MPKDLSDGSEELIRDELEDTFEQKLSWRTMGVLLIGTLSKKK